MDNELREQEQKEEFLIDNTKQSVDQKLRLKFDLGIVELLGSQLYTKLPSIISEFISNAYDADATKVNVTIMEDDSGPTKKTDIIIEDNGIGLTSTMKNQIEEINEKFLKIGRRRRKEENNIYSLKLKRKLQGKKGIGKLAGFGITNLMKITTTSNGITNSFVLDFDKMKETMGDTYLPEHIIKSEELGYQDGTTIELVDIKRKGAININDLSESIVKRMQIFDSSFALKLTHICNNMVVNEIELSNDLYLEYIKRNNQIQFTWNFPKDIENLNLDSSIIDFFKDNKITGEIFTTEKPLKKEDQGIILYANGRLCQDNYSFNERANDNFYSYLMGSLNIDFVDEDLSIDNISTARDSLVWENPISQELKEKIDLVIKKVQAEWRTKRKLEKEEEVNKKLDIDIEGWLNTLSPHEKQCAKKIVDVVINDENIGIEKSTEYVKYIQDMYSFTSFKDFAAKLIEKPVSSINDVLTFIKDWELIEAKEMAKISEGRIEAIKNFEEMILNNESESKVIQPFLEKFPWILDPSVESFRREIPFSTILKENFPDNDLDEPNRRIDFMCFSCNNEIHIWELKRPNIKINADYINQIFRYQEFAMEKYPNHTIKTTLVSDNWNYDRGVGLMIKSAEDSGNFKIRSYSEMLKAAKSYHDDFINKYNELYNKKEELNQ